MPPQIKKIPLPFPASWTSSVLQLFLPLVSLRPFSGPPIPDISCQYQLHHHCFYACFRTSWTLYKDTVLCKEHKSTTTLEAACIWQCTPDTWTNLHDWICKYIFAFLKVCDLKGTYYMWGTSCISKEEEVSWNHTSLFFICSWCWPQKSLEREPNPFFLIAKENSYILNRIQHMLCMDTKY